jgi:uncharacterized membrane protein
MIGGGAAMQIAGAPAARRRGWWFAAALALAVCLGAAVTPAAAQSQRTLDASMRECLQNARSGANRGFAAGDRRSAGTSSAEVRAFVVGVDYQQAVDETGASNIDLHLDNTLNDTCLVNLAFDKLPHAYSSLLANPSADDLAAALETYVSTISPNDVAVFYFAGHGLQAGGANYFLMADGRWAVPVDEVLVRLMQRARAVVFIVDACRNNGLGSAPARTRRSSPAPAAGGALSRVRLEELAYGGIGLAQLGRARGSNAVVLFSTEPGNVAWDGDAGGYSPFARAIYYELDRRASFDDVARRISNRVACETARRGMSNADRCAKPAYARRVATQAAAQIARATAGRSAADAAVSTAQFPWRQGDVGFPIYLAGEPRFPVP